MQTRRHSLAETLSQVVSGYLVSLVLQLLIFPLYNIHISFHQNIQLGLWFTVAAIIKGYFVRRMWNRAIVTQQINK